MLCNHINNTFDHWPVVTETSIAPYNDMIITIGTTIETDTQIAVFNGPSPGFTRNLKAKPFANPETTNQSQHIAKI